MIEIDQMFNGVIPKVEEILIDFLKINGGMSSGYITWVQLEAEINISKVAMWATPTSDKLTGQHHKRLGFDLNNKILSIMKECGISLLNIQPVYTNDGCYEIIIEVPVGRKLNRNLIGDKLCQNIR